MFEYNRVNMDAVKEFSKKYYDDLTAPMDDMWEHGIIPKGDYYEIVSDKRIGYFVLDNNSALLQFYVRKTYGDVLSQVFKDCLKNYSIEHALVSTYDPIFLSLCMEESRNIEINSILYRGINTGIIKKPLDAIEAIYAHESDFDAVIKYHEDKVDITGEWLLEYCRNLISKGGLVLYKIGADIIGTGEMRVSISSPEFCNVGMTVDKDLRRKGIGSYILSDIKVMANEKSLKVICSTSIDNVASQKTILKSGFFPYNRILDVQFK